MIQGNFMPWLKTLYITLTILGVGITLMDLLGIFSSHDDGDFDSDAGFHDDGGDAHGDIDSGGGHHVDVDSGADGHSADSHDGDDSSDSGKVISPNQEHHGSWVLRIYSLLRMIIYFSMGFGPMGWMALNQYGSSIRSLLWSVPSGIIVLIGVKILRKIMKKELDSEIKDEELLMENGKVIVSIPAKQIGKVRVFYNGTQQDRYARGENDQAVAVGAPVVVIEVNEECIIVREIEE